MGLRKLRKLYVAFFESKGHKRLEPASLIPENDPSVLFTTAGMHPLVPFLLGEPHPLGKRLVDVQKCIRTGDIDRVGNETHLTFFEMLGNWSLGDYFKKESISWSWEFLTDKEWLGLDPERIAVSVFAGDSDAPRDSEAAGIWHRLGVPAGRIAYLSKEDNWWGPAGETGPCGPDSEIFYWKLDYEKPPAVFDPKNENWVEIWNNVFMQYNKTREGRYVPLKQKNVDTGMGVERVVMVLQGKTNVFETEAFEPIIRAINDLAGSADLKDNEFAVRVIADHLKAATFILGDERAVTPSNVDQGYILRRFIRRAIRYGRMLGIKDGFCTKIADAAIGIYKDDYPLMKQKSKFIKEQLRIEEERFNRTIEKGLNEFGKVAGKTISKELKELPADAAFLLFQSYGFPIEMTVELAKEKGLSVDKKGFEGLYRKHQEISRKGAEQKFKGGLSDESEKTTRLHTATHILNEALRKVIDPEIRQKGSNINSERLRFDFNFERKLTGEEIKRVEDEVNRVISLDLPVERLEMSPEEAVEKGAQSEFGASYPSKVFVYKTGGYSMEICMGPHVKSTGELGRFRIIKEESSAAGVRRIKAVLE
ncbi:MAG TPA: alanine--tRNA ligase [Candidatus Woesearchaeota archaeon]|nr:alanine--tRNA ligase [Candidatus Woesearchaeota archaeon]